MSGRQTESGLQAPPDTTVWWEQRRHQRCPWCRPPRPLLAPRHAQRHQHENQTCLQTKCSALAQRQPGTEWWAVLWEGTQGTCTHHRLHSQGRAEPPWLVLLPAHQSSSLSCREEDLPHLTEHEKSCLQAQSWKPHMQWDGVQCSKGELWKLSHVSSCSKAGHTVSAAKCEGGQPACSGVSYTWLSQRSSRHWKWP